MISIKSSPYAQYLDTSSPSSWLNSSHKVDFVKEQILNHILLMSFKGKDLFVGDLLLIRQFGSQASIHKRLMSLSAKGYIELREDETDRRKKLVLLTEKADEYYQKLSGYLHQTLQHIAR
jgi:hypothetical protein